MRSANVVNGLAAGRFGTDKTQAQLLVHSNDSYLATVRWQAAFTKTGDSFSIDVNDCLAAEEASNAVTDARLKVLCGSQSSFTIDSEGDGRDGLTSYGKGIGNFLGDGRAQKVCFSSDTVRLGVKQNGTSQCRRCPRRPRPDGDDRFGDGDQLGLAVIDPFAGAGRKALNRETANESHDKRDGKENRNTQSDRSMSKSVDLSNIRNRAQGIAEGEVTPAEVELARDVLKRRTGQISAALYIVGLCGDASDAELIESYLHGAERDVHGETALKALCRYLNLVDRYHSLVRRYIMADRDLDWMNSRMAAIHLADLYLARFEDDEVGCRLVDIFGNLAHPLRASARSALVDFLNLRHVLADPFGLDLEEWDEDEEIIASAAVKRFKCKRHAFPGKRSVH
ncbi:hypothetical protein [Sinorhizobium saheli]|nr:hypothetical protein [Sinorhizobium saheli]MQW89620.1 hypothetical protein [Sinorhizobium saheli]